MQKRFLYKTKLPCHFDDLLGGKIPKEKTLSFRYPPVADEKSPRKKMVLFLGDFSSFVVPMTTFCKELNISNMLDLEYRIPNTEHRFQK